MTDPDVLRGICLMMDDGRDHHQTSAPSLGDLYGHAEAAVKEAILDAKESGTPCTLHTHFGHKAVTNVFFSLPRGMSPWHTFFDVWRNMERRGVIALNEETELWEVVGG